MHLEQSLRINLVIEVQVSVSNVYHLCYSYSSSSSFAGVGRLITAGWDRKIISWDTRSKNTLECLTTPFAEVESMAVSGFNLMVAVGSSVHIYDLRNFNKSVYAKELFPGFRIQCVRTIPNSEGIVTNFVIIRVFCISHNIGCQNYFKKIINLYIWHAKDPLQLSNNNYCNRVWDLWVVCTYSSNSLFFVTLHLSSLILLVVYLFIQDFWLDQLMDELQWSISTPVIQGQFWFLFRGSVGRASNMFFAHYCLKKQIAFFWFG